MLRILLPDKLAKPLLEDLPIKSLGVAADGGWIVGGFIEFFDHFDQSFGRLLVEEGPCYSFAHRVQYAASGVGNDWSPRCLGLHGGDAEVLLAGQDESPTAGEIVADFSIRHAPQEFDIGLGQGLQAIPIPSVSDDHQW